MAMTLDCLKSYQVSGTVLSAFHASSHLILKTHPRGVIIPILEMRKLCFIVNYLARRHTHSQEVEEPRFRPKVSSARPQPSPLLAWPLCSQNQEWFLEERNRVMLQPNTCQKLILCILQLYFIHLNEINSV